MRFSNIITTFALSLLLSVSWSANAVVIKKPERSPRAKVNRTVAAASNVVRVATTNNSVFNGKAKLTGFTKQYVRWPLRIGSGDFSDLKITLIGWALGAQGATNLPNDYTVTKASLQNDANTINVPVNFSGQRSIVVPMGANDLQSDSIPASAFSLTKFSRGERYWFKAEVTVNDGEFIPFSTGRNTASVAGSSVLQINPANSQVSDVDSLGAYTTTGTKPVKKATGFCPFVIGTFVSGDPATWLAAGDIIFAGNGDKGSAPEGKGAFQRALLDDLTDQKVLAGFNFSFSGSKFSTWALDARTFYWLSYAKYFISGLGLQEFGVKATLPLATVQSRAQGLWSSAYANGAFQVIQAKIGPRTTSTDFFATEANQVPSGGVSSGWDTGGSVSQFNTWVSGEVGINLDSVVSMNAWRGTNPTRWITNGTAKYATANGTVPTEIIHTQLGQEIRQTMDAYP